MFVLVSDPSSQKLGIEIHQFTTYSFDSGFLEGNLVHDSTSTKFNLFAAPNYGFMAGIATQRKDLPLEMEFDHKRQHSLHLGKFDTSEQAQDAVASLETSYRDVLKEKGAQKRRLREKGNELELAWEDSAQETRYGEAIIKAVNKRIFSMLDENEGLDHRNIVGKIMPAYIQALGFKEYHVSHDLSKDGFGKVRFIIDGYYAFDFYEPIEQGRNPYLERYSCQRGHYILSTSTELTTESLKTNVLSFLEGLAMDLGLFKGDNLQEKAQDAAFQHRGYEFIVLGDKKTKPAILGLTAPLESRVLAFKPRLT